MHVHGPVLIEVIEKLNLLHSSSKNYLLYNETVVSFRGTSLCLGFAPGPHWGSTPDPRYTLALPHSPYPPKPPDQTPPVQEFTKQHTLP